MKVLDFPVDWLERLHTLSTMACLWCIWWLKHCSLLKIVQLPTIWHWFSVNILQLLNTFLARKLEILAYDIKICNWTWMWKHFSRSSICSFLGSSILVLDAWEHCIWTISRCQVHHRSSSIVFLKSFLNNRRACDLLWQYVYLHLLSQFMKKLSYQVVWNSGWLLVKTV